MSFYKDTLKDLVKKVEDKNFVQNMKNIIDSQKTAEAPVANNPVAQKKDT